MRIASGFAGLLLLASTGAFAATLTIEPAYPLRDERSTIRLEDARAVLEIYVTYRPNSRTALTESLGAMIPGDELEWVPRIAGLALLEARAGENVVASRAISVRAGSFALSGRLIMTAALVVLFAGAGLGFLLLLLPDR